MQTPPNTDVPKQSAQSPTQKPPWYRRTVRLSEQLFLLSLAIGGLTLLWMLVRPSGQQPPTSTAQVATATPQPTATPSPTAQTVTVGGYTFGLPQAVPGDIGPIDLIGWLPDTPHEIVGCLLSNNQLVAIDMNSGKIRYLSPPYPSRINPRHIWMLADGYVAYVTYNEQLNLSADLWMSRGWTERQSLQPVFREPGYGWMVAPNQKQMVVYDHLSLASQMISPDGRTERAAPQYQRMLSPLKLTQESQNLPTEQNWRLLFSRGYETSSSLNSRWTVFRKVDEILYFFDLVTGEQQTLELEAEQWVKPPIKWSPDGTKAALFVTKGQSPHTYVRVAIYDTVSQQLQAIKTEFAYVTNAAWAPDSQHLLISANVGKAYDEERGFEYSTSELFLVNILSPKIINPVAILPPDSAIGSGWTLSWSFDEKLIALEAKMIAKRGGGRLYRIDINGGS